MRVADFDYELPPERIAQEPAGERDASRLMVLDRAGTGVSHHRFRELPGLLEPGDLLVLNDTRVLHARLVGTKATGGRVELFLLERAGGADDAPEWRCLLRASRKPSPGSRVALGEGLEAEILERRDDRWTVRLTASGSDPVAFAERVGRMPLPPYIRREGPADPRDAEDRRRYQTVYAREPGAVAAPTAGLHFTPRLLEQLRGRGIETAFLTLHVGLGTFRPVRVERVEDHVMHDEAFVLSPDTARAVAAARQRGRRVVAVGTTVVRTLEHLADDRGTVRAGDGRCGLFIHPGFRFRVVDALVTNFHLPRSSLLMLVAAFAGRQRILAAYAEAVREGYRFYSYGDAMLIR